MTDSNQVQYSQSRELLRTQNKQRLEEPINNNILPYSVRNEGFVDDYFVGSLNVEDQYMTGTMKDRLGNTFEVWESEMPPADHDYKSTSNTSNDRHLQRLQGYDIYNEKKKTEVQGVVNPAEPMSFTQETKLRSNEMEINGRETFFNQNGLQPAQEFDDNRDMYDGYNLKSGHETRTFPLEHSWRNQLYTSDAIRKASTVPEQHTMKGIMPRRKEKCNLFAVKNANPIAISAKNARLTLPIINEATLRANKCNVSGNSRHIAEGNLDGAKLSDVDAKVIKEGRLEVTNSLKKPDQMIDGPVQMASIEQINAQREHDSIVPVATREWNMIKKIAEGIDHMSADDTELCDIMQSVDATHVSSSIPESFDHIVNKEREAKEATSLTSQVLHAPKISSHVKLDDARQMHSDIKSSDVETHTSILPAKPQLKHEKVYSNRKPMISTTVHAPKHFAKVDLPMTDRATHVVNRPGHSQILASSHTIQEKTVPETKRNNIAKEEERYDCSIGQRITSEQVSKKEEENDLYSREENPHGHNTHRFIENVQETERDEDNVYTRQQFAEATTSSRTLESHVVPTTSMEHTTYIRTNAMHSSAPTQTMRGDSVPSLGSAGTVETDRIQSVHSPDWRKQDLLVKSDTKMSEERCTPIRVPSRNIATPIRMTPQLQVESKRDHAKHNDRMTPTVHHQVPRTIPAISRDE
jgi:hypothetical protein